MKKLILLFVFIFLFSVAGYSQECQVPAGFVCISQTTANKLFKLGEELEASRDVIAKMKIADALAIAERDSAFKVIEGWKQLDVINGMIIVKQNQMIAVYEKVITMQTALIEKLEKQLNKPRSAWQKLVGIVKTVATLLAGVTLGRGL